METHCNFLLLFLVKVCTVPDIPFSMYIAEPKNYHRTYSTGDKITLACKKGFKQKAKGNPVRICISGRWTQFPFECEGNCQIDSLLYEKYLKLVARTMQANHKMTVFEV